MYKNKKEMIYKNMHSLEELKCWLYYPLRMDGLDEKYLSTGLLFNHCETSDQERYGSNNSSHFMDFPNFKKKIHAKCLPNGKHWRVNQKGMGERGGRWYDINAKHATSDSVTWYQKADSSSLQSYPFRWLLIFIIPTFADITVCPISQQTTVS